MSVEQACPRCGAPLHANAPEGLCPACLLEQGFETHTADAPKRGAARFDPPKVDDLAPLFPQLELLELIGRGGMGAVYKARQKGLDRIVALKILPPEFGQQRNFADRFTREARALARLNHPNIVAVHDVGRAGDYYYFVMEFVDGLNLRETLLAGKLKPQEAMAIVPQICDALQYAHDEGIVHRDIKPENILLDKRGRVKIADFGLAKLMGLAPADTMLTQDQQVIGTPRYMAPEQIERTSTVDHRADIYSLGVVFYEMLTGELPLGRFAPPSKKVQIDVRLDEVVLRSLEKDPERRFQQVSEFRTSVETIAHAPRGRDRQEDERRHDRHRDDHAHARHGERRRSRHGALLAIAVVLFMMLLCCVPVFGVAFVVLWSYQRAAVQVHQEQRAAMQAEKHARDEAEAELHRREKAQDELEPSPLQQVPYDPTTPGLPPPTEAVEWRELEFCIVANVGDDAKPPRVTDEERADFEAKLEADGLKAFEMTPYRWIELWDEVDAERLPTVRYQGKPYVLVSAEEEYSLKAVPQKVGVERTSRTENDAAVEIELSMEDGVRMEKLTGANLGNKLAVVAGDRVISVATIRSTISRKGVITGNTVRDVALRLVEQLMVDDASKAQDEDHDHSH